MLGLIFLFFSAPVFSETFQNLPKEAQNRFDSELVEIWNNPNKIHVLLPSNANLYKLFIDKKDHHKLPEAPHLVYDQSEEPGYFSAMKKAFRYLLKTVPEKLDFDELIKLHDLAVKGVTRTQRDSPKGEKFLRGVSSGWRYWTNSRWITSEAKLDWYQYKLLYVPTHQLWYYLNGTRLFHEKIQSRLKLHTSEEMKSSVMRLFEYTRDEFRRLLFDTCDQDLVNKLKSETQYWNPNDIFNNSKLFEDLCVQRIYREFFSNFNKTNIPFDIGKELYSKEEKKDYLAVIEEGYDFESKLDVKITSNLSVLAALEEHPSIENQPQHKCGGDAGGLLSPDEELKRRDYSAAKKRYLKLFEQYQEAIEGASKKDRSISKNQVLRSIAIFTRALLIFHIFPDGNGRTFILVLNKLLLQNHLPPVLLENPHDFAGIKGVSELELELKNGLYNALKEVLDKQ
jgi:hypothetical protein